MPEKLNCPSGGVIVSDILHEFLFIKLDKFWLFGSVIEVLAQCTLHKIGTLASARPKLNKTLLKIH